MVTASRAGIPETVQNKLLEAHGERLDGGEAGQTGEGHPALAAVGVFDRAADAEGKARASRNAYRGGHRQSQRETARLLAQLAPRVEAGDLEARGHILRRLLAGDVELFFRCVELAETGG